MALPAPTPTPDPVAQDLPKQRVRKIHVRGFKSIRDQEVDLGPLSVLVGGNGSGKSNFFDAFRLLHYLGAGDLETFIARGGGASRFLYRGTKVTEAIKIEISLDDYAYETALVSTGEDRLFVKEETASFRDPDTGSRWFDRTRHASGHGAARDLLHRSSDVWRVHHFNDTSPSAKVKLTSDVHDNLFLREDAGNLPAFLYRLQETAGSAFRTITETIQMVAPFFDGFRLQPDRLNGEKIRLEWKEKGSDLYFAASSLSDGTLRFMALVTLLLQPDPPPTILIDEPELGLHPAAVTLLAAILESVATRTQIIVSTQSVTLVDQFAPEAILVVDRRGGASEFRHLTSEELEAWLEDFSLGELWHKNVFGGGPYS
ncbi:MAG: AAA family ATPase [Acidobacteria bacterium]|nr:AAA family ATPase [Acidobacteriota bacterium]